MEEEKKKKRGWVKDAAIIFLAVLLVLTFFSNTILNRSLPEVATVYVQEGTITNKVRGTGTVTARENYDVTIDQTRKVQSVLVRVGDEVSVGDVLFTLQPGDSDELENAEKQLKTLEENYQLWLLDLTTADYFDLDRSISDAREALVEAREDRDKAEITADDLREYEEKLAELEAKQAELTAAIAALETALDDQQALVETGSDQVDQLVLQRMELEDQVHEKDILLRDLNAKIQNAEEEAAEAAEAKQADIDKAKEWLERVEKELEGRFGTNPDYQKVQDAKDAYYDAMDETEAAEKELMAKRVLYGEDYDALIREATYMEFDYKVYAITRDAEAKYRLEQKLDKTTDLSEEQKDAVQAIAQPEIDKLGSRVDYEATQLSVYLPAAVEKYAGTDMAKAYAEIDSAEQQVEIKRQQEQNARQRYNEEYKKYKEDKEEDDEFQALDAEKTRAETALEKAKAAQEKAQEPMNATKEKAQMDKNRVEKEKTELNNAIDDLNYRINQLRGDGQEVHTELQAEKDKLDKMKAEQAELQADLEKNKADRDQLEKDMETRKDAYKQAKEVVKQAERNLEDRLRDLEKQKQNDGKQQVRDNIAQRDKLEEIEEQRALVEELSGADNSTEVRANVAGKIQSLSVSAGHKAEAGNVLATIEVPDLGYGMSFTVTTEQARRLKVGDSATVSNFYWGSQIVATLASIQTDPQNPQGSRILNFDVTGDVTAGNSLTISVGEKNANYDMVVPNSAVRSDTNGSFVLMVTAKNSPLGNRYFASRVNVEVVASDDQYSAISGAIEAYDSVITTASRNAPISSGDQVRLADSNNG